MMEWVIHFQETQGDVLLLLHGIALLLMATAALALGRLEASPLPWRSLAIFAMGWAISEWLEMVSLSVEARRPIGGAQLFIQIVVLFFLVRFARAGTAALWGYRVGRWVLPGFLLIAFSGTLAGYEALWISMDISVGLAGLWCVAVLNGYRRNRYPGSGALWVVCLGLGLYFAGAAVPFLHIRWMLPGLLGGWPAAGTLWPLTIFAVAVSLMMHHRHLWGRILPESPPLALSPGHPVLFAALFIILAAGWTATEWVGRNRERGEKEDLLARTQLAVAGIDSSLLYELEGVPEDGARPAYDRVCTQARAMVSASGDFRWIYGLVRRADGLFFTFDSTEASSVDFTPPGSRYFDAPKELSGVFTCLNPAVVGPYTDRWGTFVSAFVPLRDPVTGRVRVVAADLDSSNFYLKVANRRLLVLLITLLTCVVILGSGVIQQAGMESVEAVQAAQGRYLSMFHDHSAVMLLISPSDGRIMDANPSAQAFYVLSKEKLLTSTIFDFNIHPPEEIRAAMEDAKERRVARFEFYHRARGGECRAVEVDSVPIRVGGETMLFSIIHDVTEKKRTEEAKRNLEVKMMETQKLESLGVLAGGIAHDFNNILQGILGNADLAMRSAELSPQLRRRLQGIRESSERAADLCKLMLAYSGKGAFSVGPLDLAALARETVQMVKASISKKVTVDLHLAEDLPPVEGDAAQIRQVVMNLLLNASEAIGQEVGTISMTIRKGEGLERREGSGASGDWVLLEVADTGVGMDEATRARIFEPFFTTKFAGRGLGLAAVQGIVRSHCGEVSVTSTPGEGTTFRVIFPAFTSTSAKREESPPVPVVRQFRGRVLLVDDEEEIREVGQGMLENLGFDVTTAGDGLGALKLLGSGERFDAVLLDLTMPRLDGVETLNRIRADHPGLPVVLVSGYDERELSRRVSVVGLAGFLHKPFSLDSLSKTMASALNQRG